MPTYIGYIQLDLYNSKSSLSVLIFFYAYNYITPFFKGAPFPVIVFLIWVVYLLYLINFHQLIFSLVI